MGQEDHLWECPPRTKAKLEILTHYLSAWFGILASNGFRHVFYIDGFCGPGQYLGGEDGSPVIATRLANSTAQKNPGFKATLIFVDNEPQAIEHLKAHGAIKGRHSNVVVDLKQGTFMDEVDGIVGALEDSPSSPVFSFIDPFGFSQSPFNTFEQLMRNKSSEIFINLMCGFMNRFKEHSDDRITQNIRDMVGTDDLSDIIKSTDPIDAICFAFEKNLRTIGEYTLKFMMRDEGNIRDNAFFFSGKHPRGFEKIKQAMWKVDPIHGNSFSAFSSGGSIQSDLFESGPQTQELYGLIANEFGGRSGVSVEEVFKWVIEETDTFLSPHARVELEMLNQRGTIKAIHDPSGSKRKRAKNTWPKRLLLDFA